MIQRIQTLFLFLAGISFVGLFIFPFAQSNEAKSPIFEDLMYNINDNVILLGLALLGAVLALINIFLFKNRELQLRIGYLLIIFSIFLPAVAIWIFFTNKELISDQLAIQDGLGLYLPIVSLIAAVLSNRYINKDNKIVKSMDRLR